MPKVYSAALVGLSAELVEIEAEVLQGLPATVVVGLPDTAVQEARERVRFAIRNSGCEFPRSRVVINLAPAGLPKIGSHYDLPIALSVLLNSGQISFPSESILSLGELALDGQLRPVPGVLPILLSARRLGFKKALVPSANRQEAALVSGLEAFAADNLIQVVNYLRGELVLPRVEEVDWDRVLQQPSGYLDMKLIQGQAAAKRALEVAAAGGHNLLLSGPPGAGKTLLAKALPSILPKMSVEEVLEVTKIYSVCGLLAGGSLAVSRPFRHPHHSASAVSLVGGGANLRPGEITLAHRGVLFLDEIAEFSRSVLENLRQPLEDGRVTVSRASGSASFPAQFILVAAQNPCPCGYYGSEKQECTCSLSQVLNYQRKVSGPLLDRIDIFIEAAKVEYEKLASHEPAESSERVRLRVQAARDRQAKRFAGSGLITNSEMGMKELRQHCRLKEDEQQFMKQAALKLNLSARAFHRVLKLARTIADLAGSDQIAISHLAEAVQYRTKTE